MQQPAISIIKASGERVAFDEKKLAWSIERAGASKKLARATAAFIATRVRDGMTTSAILTLVRKYLGRESVGVAARYSLKDAMRRLGPAGYEFEQFIAEVLRAYGYATELPDMLPGMCVQHEVDVIARLPAGVLESDGMSNEKWTKAGKDGTTVMIECKYRNEAGIYVRLKDVMATWARYDDLREAYAAGKCPVGFTGVWILCNTKITSDGIAFGECKGMRCIGWRYPADGGLERLIELKRLYPITILSTVDQRIQERLAAAGAMLCRDIIGVDVATFARQTGIPALRMERIQREVEAVLRC